MAKKSEEIVEEPLDEIKEPEKTTKKSLPAIEKISSKQFIVKIKEELKSNDEYVPQDVFIAFRRIVPVIETEENYRMIWKETFKRD